MRFFFFFFFFNDTATTEIYTLSLHDALPIIDTFYVLVRRMLSGRPPYAPDRGHFHHRLLDVGLTHQQAVLFIYGMTAILIALAFLLGVAVMALAQRSAKAEELDPGLYREEADRF